MAFPTAQNDQSGVSSLEFPLAMDMADDDELGQVSTIRRVSPVPLLRYPPQILKHPDCSGEDAIEPGDRPQETRRLSCKKALVFKSGFPDDAHRIDVHGQGGLGREPSDRRVR